MFAVNTVNEEISYAFPQFEQKPSPLYLNNFIHKLENNNNSKKELFDKIKNFQQKFEEEIQKKGNSLALARGKGIPLENDLEMNLNGSITYKYKKGTSVNLKNIRVIPKTRPKLTS